MVILKALMLSKAFQSALVQGGRGTGNRAHKGFDNVSFKRDRKGIGTIVSFGDDLEEVDDYEGDGHEREFPYPANKDFIWNNVASRKKSHPLPRTVKSKNELKNWHGIRKAGGSRRE